MQPAPNCVVRANYVRQKCQYDDEMIAEPLDVSVGMERALVRQREGEGLEGPAEGEEGQEAEE